MKITLKKETIVTPLQQIIGAVEKRQTLPVLGNVLLSAHNEILSMTATDTEIELQSRTQATIETEGSITVPARKLLDICRALPDEATIKLELSNNKLKISSGRSKFVLSTLPASDFPLSVDVNDGRDIEIPGHLLSDSVKRTQFSMANQDVRFYLNGLLLEVTNTGLRCVATDGHRLAFSSSPIESTLDEPIRVIIPRKSVLELSRLINADDDVSLRFTQQHLKLHFHEVTLTTKLIDGRFPDYNRVIPVDCDKELILDKDALIHALSRASILSNEKYRGIRMRFENNILSISTNNPDQEEASEELEISYSASPVEIGFNVIYLLEALNRIETENVRLLLKDGNSSCLIMPVDSDEAKYVIMPMRL
ncbi:MAG: DNA polymerase III subunit beta [Gammaproteobacteria bacterium]|nr:DNA polymerase III subunit beta [Gammaproteobacteria bacterium]